MISERRQSSGQLETETNSRYSRSSSALGNFDIVIPDAGKTAQTSDCAGLSEADSKILEGVE